MVFNGRTKEIKELWLFSRSSFLFYSTHAALKRNLIKFKTTKYPNLNLDGYSYIEQIVVAI
jgi:hypothetical protein